MTRAAFPEPATRRFSAAAHATTAAARQRAISAALYLSAMQGARRTALRAPRNVPHAPLSDFVSRILEAYVTDSGIPPRRLSPRLEQSHPLREKSQTPASALAIFLALLAVFTAPLAIFAVSRRYMKYPDISGKHPIPQPAPILLVATPAILALLLAFSTSPAHAQSTNQLFMTGTGSGSAPTLYTNGVDSNINLAIMPKGTGNVGIGTTSPYSIVDIHAPNSGGNGLSLSITSTGNAPFITWKTGDASNPLFSMRYIDGASGYLVMGKGDATGHTQSFAVAASGNVGIGTMFPSALLDIGLAGTTTGTLRLEGKTSGYVQVQTANAAGNATFQLPSSNGSNGQCLQTNGSGVTSWASCGAASSLALSSVTSATGTNTIDSTNNAQTWQWGTLSTGTALTLSTSSMTTGTLLSLQDTAVSATSTGKVLSISDTTTGPGYGVYSVMSGKANSGYAGYFTNTGSTNTGYAGYFTNTDTSTNSNYGVFGIVHSSSTSTSAGVYGEGDCSNCYGVYGASANNIGINASGGYAGVNANSSSTGAGYGVLSQITGAANTGYAGYFTNTATTGANYGVYATVASTDASATALYGANSAGSGTGNGVKGTTNSTGAGFGVIGTETSAANTGYAGYFSNSTTKTGYGIYTNVSGGSNTGYGIYSTNDSSSGYAGFFTSAFGYAVYGQANGAANTGYAGYFQNTATTANYGVYSTTASTGTGYGVYGAITGHGNSGYGGYFSNTDTGTLKNYGVFGIALGNPTNFDGAGVFGECDTASCNGVYGISSNGVGAQGYSPNNIGVFGATDSTGAGMGVEGLIDGHANTGYAGYFTNTGTGAANYGIYASAASTNASAYAGYFSGNIYLTGTITMTSDRRAKKNIEALDTGDALDEIASLRPVSFAWKKNGAPDMGLIAQEVDDVFPDLVVHGGDKTLALKYVSLIAPMIASIQELKKRDDELEVENAALRRDFETYKAAHP